MRNLLIVILSLVSFCANAQYDYLSAKKILVSQSFRPGPDTTVSPLWVGEIRQSVEGGVGKIWICISLTGQKWQQISGSGGGDVASVFGRTGAVSALQADYAAFYEPIISTGTTLQYIRGDKSLATLNTSVVPESGNLYFTNARARGAISLTTTGTSGAASYNSTTGVLNIPAYEAGSGTVTNIATNTATGITGGPITTTGTLSIDTNLLKTHASHKKAIDSLGALIGSAGVTSVGTGTFLTGGPITTTGTVSLDTSNAALKAYIAANGSTSNILQGGNSFGTTATIGTNNPQSLAFETNGIERMVINSNGNIGIGSSTPGFNTFLIAKNATGGSTVRGISVGQTIQSDVATYAAFRSGPVTQSTAFTVGDLYHFIAESLTIGAGSSVTNQFGYVVGSNMTGGANNYGFFGNIPASSGRWNLYMGGTASNYFAGATSIGTPTIPTPSIFNVTSTSLGSIPAPKMTTAQRDAIASPTAGLQVFNTTTNKPNYYNGTSWVDNGTSGTATLAAGTVTVSTSAVTANSKIYLTVNTPGGTQGFLSAPAASRTAATSFVINSTSATETSTVDWFIVNY